MSERGYEIVSIDDLDRHPRGPGEPVLMPLRRRVGFRPYGVNCWTAVDAGDHVIERHREADGPEELYLVLRGHATFTVGEELVDAPPGTLVHVPPGTVREAVAGGSDTVVLAIGAKPGEVFKPSGWEDFHIAESLRQAGRADAGRELMRAALERDPSAWQGHYNAACFESLAGDPDAAFAHLGRALRANAPEVRKYAKQDGDFASIRDDPRWQETVG